MNKSQPLVQVRPIVASALNQTAKVRENFQSFFMETMILIISMYGKVNFLSMARHGDSCESRFRQNFRKPFDWCSFNRAMLLEGCDVAIALDHSFLPKAGKKTPGLGKYWSGCASAVKRGLEILGFAQIVPRVSDARFLFAVQTLPCITKGRTPFYLEHMKDDRDKQNPGLEDWQSRAADSLSLGYNASLTAVNVAREMADDIEKATGRRLSVTSVKKVIHNAALYQNIKEFIEGLKSEDPQINFTLSDEIPDKLLFFGVRDSA